MGYDPRAELKAGLVELGEVEDDGKPLALWGGDEALEDAKGLLAEAWVSFDHEAQFRPEGHESRQVASVLAGLVQALRDGDAATLKRLEVAARVAPSAGRASERPVELAALVNALEARLRSPATEHELAASFVGEVLDRCPCLRAQLAADGTKVSVLDEPAERHAFTLAVASAFERLLWRDRDASAYDGEEYVRRALAAMGMSQRRAKGLFDGEAKQVKR
ncbi:MAG: hypothetical protein KA712_16870 [Myxococcales bacterium]|nr:hypothetical protein [Myxococcales bacterium]